MFLMRGLTVLLGVLCLLSCRSNKPVSAGTTDTATTANGGSDGTVQDDTGPVTDASSLFPTGRWSDCSGAFQITVFGTWSWANADTGCTADGVATGDDTVLELDPPTASTCGDDLPWWLPAEMDDPFRYNYADNGTRLTLVPEVSIGSTGSTTYNEKHLYSEIQRNRWLLENQDGLRSHFDACFSPEGVFFEGGYRSIDDSCEFLSCGGAISEWRVSDGNVHIWTACAGDCPCAGVVVATTHSDTEMAGNYAGANCALVMEGTFTGTRLEFPDGDAAPR
jgi:hypothetical protein